MKLDYTRRHLLHLGTAALTTSIAGCVGDDPLNNDPFTDTPQEDTAPDGEKNETTETVAYFHAALKMDLYRLPKARGRPTDLNEPSKQMPDNTLFSIEIQNSDTAVVTLEKTNVNRKFELRLYIRNANREFERVTTTLEATDTDTPETRTAEFDISSITLPRDAGSVCQLVGVDDEFDPNAEFIIKRHQFVGVSHNNGTNWVNNDHFNYTYRRNTDGSVVTETPTHGIIGDVDRPNETPAGYVETRDGENERTVFLVTRTNLNGELVGVAAHIPHKPVNDYKNGSRRYRYLHDNGYEAHFATEITHYQELADTTHNAISGIGTSNTYERTSVLADLVQMIPYKLQGDDPLTSAVLYDLRGDCSSKSMLMSCILQNDPWNLMPAFIDCKIRGQGHWTLGIDVDDIPNLSLYDAYTINPTDSQVNHKGFTDTQYAFLDMTVDADIGQRTQNITDVTLYDEGDFTKRDQYRRSDEPPTY